MYCPICSGEYREDIDTCPACGEPLTVDRPRVDRGPVIKKLPIAATLAMVGTGMIFLIRTVATLNPHPGLTAARLSTIIYLLSYLTIIFFFLVFAREAVEPSQWRLKLATWVTLAGSAAAATIVTLNILILFDRPVVFGHPLGVASSVTSMLLPVTSVLFFVGFLADHRSASARALRAARFALVGSLLSAAAHGVAAALVGPSPMIPGNMTPLLLLAGSPVIAFAVGTWLYFLWVIRTTPPIASPLG